MIIALGFAFAFGPWCTFPFSLETAFVRYAEFTLQGFTFGFPLAFPLGLVFVMVAG